MKTTIKSLTLLAIMGGMSMVFAVEVTPEQAQTAVQNWVRRSPRRMTASFSSGKAGRSKTSKNKEGKALYHVVEMDEGGFVVTSGDTELPPVIAFSAAGALDLSDTGNPLVAMLERDLAARNEQLAKPKMTLMGTQAPTNGSSSSDDGSFENEWASLLTESATNAPGGATLMQTSSSSISDVRVAPMVQSKWGQSRWNGYNTFNYYTPNNYVCGCVATAFAQIMRYWQQPAGSISAGTYDCWVDDVKVSKTMKGGTYNWSYMPLSSASCSTDTQRAAIGKLLYDVGVASQMGWSSGGSGTMGCVAAQALRNRFGYASAHSYCNGYSGTLSTNLSYDNDFRNAILASLDAGMPVAIGIRGTGGHEVVVDGYGYNGGSIIYCHINCGWNGSEDAWYNLIGEGVTSHAYTLMNEVAYNIHPSLAGDVISGRVLNSSGTPVSGATVTLTSASGTQRTTTTNAKGIYAFRAAGAATYTVAAASGSSSSASQTVSLPLSCDTEWTITKHQDGYVYHTSPSSDYPDGKLGNKWGVNLTLTGTAPVPSGDAYDPGDDTAAGGTAITPSTSRATHGGHTLSATDAYDFFKVYLTAGNRYVFETTGTMDTYGELFNSTSAGSSNRVAYDDDGGDSRNFKVEYTPSASGTYYLRVRAYTVGTAGSYSLAYQRSASDGWDPADDTASGGTWLTPSTTVQTHGPHQLSAADRYDFFCISLKAGRTYVFESTGSYDMYGELFNSTTTNAGNRVAYNDDGGSGSNFFLEYTPAVSQTYYLRVRRYTVGADGAYSLKYSSRGPANDNFAGAAALTGAYGETAGSNIGASYQSGEPLPSYRSSAKNTVWWRWTAPVTATFRFSTEGTSFDTVMGVYSGYSVSTLSTKAENDDAGSTRASVCSFLATAGTTYYVAVAGYNESEGAIKLNWRSMPTMVVKFNANGGTISGLAWKPVKKGHAVGSLKKPSRSGYAFAGWYTKKSGGTKVSSKTKVGKNVTYYAHWKANKYTVTLKKSGKGTVSGGGKKAYKSKITLKAKPASGYVFLGWYKDGVLVSGKATWSTKVPLGSVTYTAKFARKSSTSAAKDDVATATGAEASIPAEAVPAFAIGSFNGWTFAADETGAYVPARKVTVTVTRAGKISAAVGSLKFAGDWRDAVRTDGQAQGGTQTVTLRTVRADGADDWETDILTFAIDPQAEWTEDQLTGALETYKGQVSVEEAEGRTPVNGDTVLSARRDPFGDEDEARELAAALAARGVQKLADADGLVWDAKVSENGVATIARAASEGGFASATAVLAVEKLADGGLRASARFLVSGVVLEMAW